MRRKRLRGEGDFFAHVTSRVVDRQYLFGAAEKDYFTQLVRKQSRFTGIGIVTSSCLSNYFHLLLFQRDACGLQSLKWPELRDRLSAIYSEKRVQSFENEYNNLVKIGDPELLEAFFNRFQKRMNDISEFVKEVKQKFTQWYNLRKGRKGTLWEGRFKSVLVQGAQQTLMVMAAYIDLNPVRAGIVSRVEDYKWCGYTAAVGGDEDAQRGLGLMLDQSHNISGQDFEKQWSETAKLYRLWFYHQGREVKGDACQGARDKKGFSDEAVERVISNDGLLEKQEMLNCRVAELSESRAFGSKEFVDGVYRYNKSIPGTTSHRNPVKRMAGSQWSGYRVM